MDVLSYEFDANRGPDASRTEWVLGNGLGGFAMGTASGTPTRRYHGLLVAALQPPVGRAVLVNQVAERLVVGAADAWLTAFRFADSAPLTQSASFRGFEKGPGWVRWRFEALGCQVEKTLDMVHGRNAVRLSYRVRSERAGRLELRPLLSLRDMHHLRTHWQGMPKVHEAEGRIVADMGVRVYISAASCEHLLHGELWRSFYYERDAERGQECVEHLAVPCRLLLEFDAGDAETTLEFSAESGAVPAEVRGERVPGLSFALERVRQADEAARAAVARLVEAADQFVVHRTVRGVRGSSVIAGYPWFTDWGRDTMISFPGLFLETGRFEEGFSVLRVFGQHVQRGLVPNRFDDAGGAAHYNTVDASLWYLHAATAWLDATGEQAAFAELVEPCVEIIAAYRSGTDFHIRMDDDSLIEAGSPETQLTWMDAQRDGVTFTPRFGKCVEINALWHHGLVRVARAIAQGQESRSRELADLARRVSASFRAQFSNPQGGLFDRLEKRNGEWVGVPEIRPNQIFAASLADSPADAAMRASAIAAVRAHLLTPFGLRTLSPRDPGYKARFEGSLFERDATYHNGTVWPWLLGPYVEAILRTDGGRAEARRLLEPLSERMAAWCLGQVSEVCDGDEPHTPGGCPAQAWSVAELLRAWMLVAG